MIGAQHSSLFLKLFSEMIYIFGKIAMLFERIIGNAEEF
jgi:hypothetical protein